MFDTLHTTYKKIISCLGIIGYLEEDIKKRGLNTNNNLPLNCLYAHPSKELAGLNEFTYQMMFPDNNHKIPCPKFFAITLTNQQAKHSYLYCLKFSEKYSIKKNKNENIEIDIPIVIFIKSEKEDLESFKQLLHLINFIIVNDDLEKDGYLNYTNINDFKKVQLMNLFYFLFSLPHTSPHSQVRLKIDKEIANSPIDSIDFYFSSNCEIPCNKNDTDINILFLLLDQSIIIKTLFAILTEKQIVFRASQAYLLHLIIPTFLKLIFPFKWLQCCITVLPKDKLDLLEAPGSFIIGVLSNHIELKDLMREYPGIIIVDCDTNEIFGDSYLEPYEPPKNMAPPQSDEKDKKNKKEKNKKDKDNKDFFSNINMGNNLTQGNNLISINGSYLYKYESEPNLKKTKLILGDKNNIIIDIKNSQLLIDKTDVFIDSTEWKKLRRNIQLVRNPEIFDLDNINNKKKNSSNGYYLNEEDEENIILPNRPFSYNIQNIFMKYILDKLSYSESDFMSIFKNTNLFLAYNEPKKYQNNSGKKIIENILELENQQRNSDNCFNVEYTLQKFHAATIINKIDEKLNEENVNKDLQNNYDKLKTIIDNYYQMGNDEDIENFKNYDGLCESERNERKSNLAIEGRKSDVRKQFGRLTKNFTKGHERNKTSVLQESITGKTNFLLMGVDNSVKGVFKFYNNNGFLEFINNFEIFLKNEKINIKDELFEIKINEQILEIILKNEDIFLTQNINPNNNNNNIKNILKKKETLKEKDLKKKDKMSIIIEKNKEDEEDDIYDGRGTVIQKNIGGDYDFATNFNNMVQGLHLDLDNINENKYKELGKDKYIIVDEDIVSFPDFNEENEEINNDNEKEENINLKSQYYLFIALILEDIYADKKKSEELIEKINNNKNIKKNIKTLLLKVYRLAYKYSGLKHRDFPYFSYYNFLLNMDLEQLKKLQEEFNDLTDKEVELFEIYGNVIVEKMKELQRKEKRKEKNISKEKEKRTSSQKKEKDNKKPKTSLFQDFFDKKNSAEKNKEKDYVIISTVVMDESPEKNKGVNNSDKNLIDVKKRSETISFKKEKVENNNNSEEFNCLISYAINTTPDFDCKNENMNWTIIKAVAQEINEILQDKDTSINTIQNILDEAHQQLISNKKIFNLIGQLRYIDPDKIQLLKERMCFWLNCFNYLMLFTFIYKKWNINNEKNWKYFFKNVKYYIGDNYYSFHDMLYIIYKKILFFPSSYKINDNLKKYRVNKTEDGKNIEKKYPLLYNPFMIYVPIKGFLKPIIYDDSQFEKQINQRIKDYFFNFLGVDYQNNILLPELIANYIPNFLTKEYKKLQAFIEPAVYEFINEKKYKSTISRNLEWKLDFEILFDNKKQGC